MDSLQGHHAHNVASEENLQQQQHSLELYSNKTEDENEARDISDKGIYDNYDNKDRQRKKLANRDDTRTDEDNDEDDNDDGEDGTDEKVNLLPCEHQYLLHDCQCQVPVYSKIEPSRNINFKRKPDKLTASQTGILKRSLEHGDDNDTCQTEALLEAQRHLEDMRRKRVFSHYRQYEQWRRRQFTCDPYYLYRPPTLYDYALPYSVTTPSAFRRRRQYQRQYSCAARSSYEDSQDSKDSQVSCHHSHHGHHFDYRRYQRQTKATTEERSVSGTKSLIVLIDVMRMTLKTINHQPLTTIRLP